MGWVSKFDNTFWQALTGGSASWSGSTWTWTGTSSTTNAGLQVKTGATWANSYRPTQWRITVAHTVSQNIEFDIFDAGGADYLNTGQVANAQVAVTGSATVFTFGLAFIPIVADIAEMIWYPSSASSGTITISNIEFFESTTAVPFWKDRVKCSEIDT